MGAQPGGRAVMSIPFIDMAAMHGEIHGELDAVWRACVDANRFIGGRLVEEFEASWAEYCQTRYCVGVSSGTAALELVLRASGIGVGDEVIVPANTFIASAAAIVAAGAKPVFVDVDPATLLITAEAVRAALSSRTAAIMPVHLYGQPVNMDTINAAAASAGVAVIEDAAQAHGASWDGQPAGSMSLAGCFSFYPGKNLGAFGDAGAVVTDDLALAEKIRSLSNHGRCHDDPYRHEMVGGTHRLDSLQAGVLSAKLKRLDGWNEARGRIARLYVDCLTDMPVQWIKTDPRAISSHHLAVVQTDVRDKLRGALTRADIGSGIHYPIPCHQQAPFATAHRQPLPVAERAARRILSLPMSPHLSDAQVARVAEVIRCTLGSGEAHLAEEVVA
jgi:dTDP-4-amino-4,6-dideoxygalactose transaminase